MEAMDLVVKIGSMALIRQEDNAIDYNTLSRLSADLRPGMILVSSGATEIGRVDYCHRTGHELQGELDDVKTDYAAQGQAILMENYRRFIDPSFSVRQVLVEHQHFNNPQKREHIRQMLLRCPAPVSYTHLDVYKRQSFPTRSGLWDRRTWPNAYADDRVASVYPGQWCSL